MDPRDDEFLQLFFRQLKERPLDPASDARYVPLYTGPEPLLEDPVALLERSILYLADESSAHLLSGFRGTGKSTELRRLRNRLVDKGYHVVLIDIEEHLSTSERVDVTDFLLMLGGAFGDALASADLIGKNLAREGYWGRFAAFLKKTNISIPDATAVGIKVSLKSDPSFRRLLQERMAGHVGALVRDVRTFFEDCIREVREKYGPQAEVVVIVDSVDHIRGTYGNANEVQESLETLFARNADKLRIPLVHLIYTVPPYLKIRSQNIGIGYDGGAVQIFPAVKIRHEVSGDVSDGGVGALLRVLEARGDVQKLFGSGDLIRKVVLASGGHLRDLLRIVREVILRARKLPVDDATVESALNQIRTELLPIADNDALWLARVAQKHKASLVDQEHLPTLAKFLDTHVVLCYRDGPEWFDVNPLIKDIVLKQARDKEIEERLASSKSS